ncbi:hypothetical protein Tco_0791110 [Tanacetum coccineum]
MSYNLSKPEESDGFEQIVDFLNAHPIKYALTVNPTIYISCIEQFWSTVKAKTINGEVQLHALVDGKKIIITESTVRRDLQLEDAEGIYSKTTAWNEFSSTMASAIICLATNQKFNFSKYIFESMIRNLDNLSGKFLMYPRFVQVFLEQQLDDLSTHNRIYVAPSHTKKIFANMRRVGKGFSGRVTPLFPTMVVQNQSQMGEGSAIPTDPHHTPTFIQPSPQPQKTQKPRKPKRKDTQVSATARVESSRDEESLGEDASKQERINAIDADDDITLVSVQDDVDKEMFDLDALNGEEVFVAGQNENVSLEALKTLKPKVKGIVFQEPSKSTTTTTISTQQSQDKGKGIMIEELVKTIKKKDPISFDEEVALKLQAKFDEEERLAREKAEKEKEANIVMIETWDDI